MGILLLPFELETYIWAIGYSRIMYKQKQKQKKRLYFVDAPYQ